MKKKKKNLKEDGIGIYIHWPFCQSLCPYCDFNSYVSEKIDMDHWSTAYKKALRISAMQVDNNLVHSIYFGGGTPSLMSSRLVYDVINEISKEFKVSSDAEISLEANPTSVEYGKFKSYSASGVNRCSLGIQALNDADLKSLGRLHSVNDALRAFDSARQCFKTSSFDLIYGRQNQTIGEWENELKRAMSLDPQHLSLYQLTIEPGTPFFKLQQKNRLRGLPNDSKSCAFYTKTKEICKNNELVHYEISNFATKGHESVHNLNYWRYGDFIGIGPGASGRISISGNKYETEGHKNPMKWLGGVLKNGGEIYSVSMPLSFIDQAKEYAVMSFRLKEGLNIERFNSFSELKLSLTKVEELEEMGLINKSHNSLYTTEKGELLLNSILSHLLN